MTVTALFAEFLVIGATSWLWLIPLLFLLDVGSLPEMVRALRAFGSVGVGGLIVGTYVLGIVTDSVASVVEGWVTYTGRSVPHLWFRRAIGDPAGSAWTAAQSRIWESDHAFREFGYDRMRLTIGRGLGFNAGAGALLWAVHAYGPAVESVMPGICTALVLAGVVTWSVASREYYRRVDAAGQEGRGA